MFEKNDNINEFDLMMKSILDEGQEEVPARVWDAVSEGLDNAARRKTVVLWLRRVATGVAAAAAIAIGVILNIRPETDLVPVSGNEGLIAVVEPEEEVIEEPVVQDNSGIIEYTGIAQAKDVKEIVPKTENIIPQTASEAIGISDAEPVAEFATEPAEEPATEPVAEQGDIDKAHSYFQEDWTVEEEKTEKKDISFMLSGLAGPFRTPCIRVGELYQGQRTHTVGKQNQGKTRANL